MTIAISPREGASPSRPSGPRARTSLVPVSGPGPGARVVSWLTSTDHKVIGNLYLVTSFAFFLLGGVMALVIRAELFQPGLQVVATPRGYMLLSPLRPEGIVKTVVTRHGDYKSMEEELRIMVNNGARVLNVIVEHPVYGEITGNLMISTPEDVSRFMDNITGSEGEPLSSLTGGVHLHTLEVRDEASWKKILRALKEKNYLPDEK